MGRHVAGKLKQTNKKHKSNVASNRSQQRMAGAGKVAGKPSGNPKAEGALNAKQIEQLSISKSNRVNHKLQLRKKKLDDAWLSRRIGTNRGPPKVVAVIPLSQLADARSVVSSCLSSASWSAVAPEAPLPAQCHASFLNHKARMCFLSCAAGDVMKALDTAKCADIVVFVVSACSDGNSFIDETGVNILTALKSEGMPEVVCCMQGLMQGFDYTSGMGGSGSVARQSDLKQAVQAAVAARIGPDVKCIQEENNAVLIRNISVCVPRDISWRMSRSYLISEEVQVAASADPSQGTCAVRVSGYLRGTPMRLHSLMYIGGVGACRVVSVEAATSPYDAARKSASAAVEVEKVVADPAKQDALAMEAVPDGIAGEQTWPSEMEMGGDEAAMGIEAGTADGAGRLRRKIQGEIPKGMSSYQADWMVGDDGEWLSGDEEDGEGSQRGPAKGPALTLSALEEKEYGTAFDGEDLDAIAETAPKVRRTTDYQSHLEFPDEIDTPDDIPARQRFARYRALQSFRSSPWHPKENLPADYARIHQFERFENSQKWVQNEVANAVSMQNASLLSAHSKAKVEARGARSRTATAGEMDVEMAGADEGDEMETEGATTSSLLVGDTEYVRSGIFVIIELSEVPNNVERKLCEDGRLQLFSLLRHENKASVMHFTLQRTQNYNEPIKSKDRMIMQVGFRMFPANPIFSEANLNCDKHKMERYLPEGFSVASCYGPITFQPCPVLMYKEVVQPQYAPDGTISVQKVLVLVATGSLSSVDPNRIVLKKIILTGHPIRVHKRCAVLKHLFHEPQDARWFKPAELVTKHGLRGHIREPVGTHGLLKAVFSAPLTQNDTVMLILYKRVFPKFPEEGQIVCA